ncbi:ABC transporter permease [Paenibacillus sp. 1P07SE]|uniref:ABC transporter permease n=1 Tax=Paenibacillus sp. 1P07SE TaxID=3132209 RepID=UPI0039A68DF6
MRSLPRIKSEPGLLKRIKADRYLLIMLLPGVLYFLLFKYLPMFGVLIAFKNYNVFAGFMESDWVGMRYFRMFFDNPDAWPIIRNTLLLGIYRIIWGFPAPIILALLLNEIRIYRFKRFVQTVSYMPHFISTVVVTGMVAMFLSPTNGIVNLFLENFGVQPTAFLQNPNWFRTIYIASDIWQEVGWGSIIYLAALTTIDPSQYEAAAIDGASRWRQMISVTLPGIMPAIIILFILRVGNVLETGFEKVYLLYNPATYDKADILATYVYRIGLTQGNYSYGTAIDLFTGVIGLLFVISANYMGRRAGETSLW